MKRKNGSQPYRGLRRIFRRSRSCPRVVVLGIDGMPFSFAKSLCESGQMPNLASLTRGGTLRAMDSVVPCLSGVAWTSFLTGMKPGGFDLFGFAELNRNLEIRIPDSRDVRADTLIDLLSRAGRRVISLGMPVTHPPRPANGIVVGDFLAEKLEDTVYPPESLEYFQKMGYRIDSDPVRAQESLEDFKEELLDVFQARTATLLDLMAREPWDLFMAHVIDTDRLNHFLWGHMEAGHPEHTPYFMDFYKRVDRLIGEVVSRLQPSDQLFILSDHGFCSVKQDVQLNFWLEQEGYLSYRSGEGFGAIDPASRAVAMVPGRIYLLTQDRWVDGRVADEDAPSLREEIRDRLQHLRDPQTGEPICQTVWTKEEVFAGPMVRRAPDLVAEPLDGYDLKAGLYRENLFSRTGITGMHTRTDALLASTACCNADSKPRIFDVMPTLLDILDLPKPDDLHGRSLVSAAAAKESPSG